MTVAAHVEVQFTTVGVPLLTTMLADRVELDIYFGVMAGGTTIERATGTNAEPVLSIDGIAWLCEHALSSAATSKSAMIFILGAANGGTGY